MEDRVVKQVIVVRRDLNMRKGKTASQVAHAAMKFLVDSNESERDDELYVKLSNVEVLWLTGKFTKIVVGCDSEEELSMLVTRAMVAGVQVHQIVDCGLTEFKGVHTLTCAAFGPDYAEVLDSLTGHLQLI